MITNRTNYMLRLASLALGLSLAVQVTQTASAAVWTYTNRTSTVWTLNNSWQTNGAWGAPPLGVTNFPGRINVNASVLYDYTTNTGFGTIINASPEFGRGLVIASGSGTTGAVEIATGGIVAFQAALQEAVIVGAPGGNGTSKGYLNLTGGHLTIVATNFGVLSCPYRGGPNALGAVTIGNGSVLTVDRFRFGGQTVAAADIGAGCSGNLFLNPGGTLLVRNIANQGNPTNMRGTNFFNGGLLRIKGPEENRNPLIGSNIVNSILAGGLVVDTAGYDGRIMTPLENGTGGADGGIIKNGAGRLNLYGPGSTYTGPTIVNAGTLGVQVPMASSDFRVAPEATLNLITDHLSPWSIASLNLTNTTLGFDYGNYAGYSSAVVAVGTLRVQGNVKINLVGTSFPVTTLTLLTYTTKTGGGTISLGTLPTGAVATLEDTGSALRLHITSASLQALTWTASVNNTWQTNGAANWNFGTATYLEYPSGVGDIVTFDDMSFGTVNLGSVVRPTSVTAASSFSQHTFSGSGSIQGPTGILKEGAGTLDLSTSNDYLGATTINGGSASVGHAKGLGATNEGTVVATGATLAVGVAGGSGVAVAGEAVAISGAGVGGALGALRGGATASGQNVWSGPVTLGADNSRIGTEDGGNLTISGDISDRNSNYGLILRPGAGGELRLSGSNRWSGNTAVFGGGTGKLVLGSATALPVGSPLLVGEAVVDVNGFSPTVAGLALNGGAAGNAIIRNDGATPATITLDPLVARNFPGSLTDGTATLGLIKTGTNSQALTGYNTYTGPTLVNGGDLALTLPSSSLALVVADGARLALNVGGFTWSPAAVALTNGTLALNYGELFGLPPAVLVTTTLAVSGSNVVNLTGTNFPASQIPLLTYSSKSGGGTFHLGTMPAGVQAAIVDTGSAIVLDVTVAAKNLTWFGGAAGTWNTTGTLDWNFGMSAYQEYGPATNGVGDFVTFDDTAAVFGVSVAGTVRPLAMTVNNGVMSYTFSGPGAISGPASLTKLGASELALTMPNTFTGGTAVRGGALTFTPGALGSTGNVVVAATGTLRWADANTQDLSSRIRIDGSGTTLATLDVGTNHVTFASGISQNSAGGAISNAVGKLGSGTLTLASGVSTLGHVVRVNAGVMEVLPAATLTVDGNGVAANAALVVDNASMTVAGGAVNVGDRFGLATAGNSTATLTLDSGSVTVDTGSSDGTRGLRLAGAGGQATPTANNTATVHLNGGSLAVARIFPGTGENNTSLVHFNGGTLRPSGNALADIFMTGLTHAYVQAGGARVDTAGASLTIGQALENDGVATPDGGLTKLGLGMLTLTAANTYTGPTHIEQGLLNVSGSVGPGATTVHSGGTLAGIGTVTGPVTVQAGGALQPGAGATVGESLIVSGPLSLAGMAHFDLAKPSGTPASDQVVGVTDITYGGALVVTNTGEGALAIGDVFTLFSASGTKTGNFASIQVLPASLGLSGSFNPATGQLTLTSAAPPALSYTYTGSALQFSWTGSYKLQAQTNSLSVGIGNNWADYPGGASSPVNVPVDSTKGTVFFRLAAP